MAEILLTVFEHESYPPVKITEYSQLEIQVIRICAIAVLLGLFFSVRTSSGEDAQADGETRPLLTGSSSAHGNAEGNGNPILAGDQSTLYGTDDVAGTAYGTAHDARSRDEAAWKSLLLKAKGYINAPGISESCATWRSSAQDMVVSLALYDDVPSMRSVGADRFVYLSKSFSSSGPSDISGCSLDSSGSFFAY